MVEAYTIKLLQFTYSVSCLMHQKLMNSLIRNEKLFICSMQAITTVHDSAGTCIVPDLIGDTITAATYACPVSYVMH